MPDPVNIAIFGAGGFSRETAGLLPASDCREHRLVGFVDDFASTDTLGDLPVMSLDTLQAQHPDARIVLAVGDGATRHRIVQRLNERGIPCISAVHRSVVMGGRVSIGEGSILCAGTLMTVDITLGEHVHVNLGCTVGHDVIIDAFASVAPGVNISGNVHIGREAWIGTGASIINGKPGDPLVIGAGSVVAAGACVTGHVEPGALYAGVPARLKKHL